MSEPLHQTPTYIYAMGGLEEIGKNMYIVEHDDEMVILDAGIKFASDDMLGINTIVPSFDWLKRNEHKIKGVFITHGHEDHIGGVPQLLREVNIKKIYAARLTVEMLRKRMSEYREIKGYELVEFSDESIYTTKHFTIDFFRVHHSIPDSFGIAVSTPNGLIVNAGDYRFDFTPLGDATNIHKIADIGRRNVTLFLAESTNSEKEGFSETERKILGTINNIIKKTKGRIILSTFASNLGRIEEVVALAANAGRKICILGRSMENNIAISRKIGYLKLSDKSIIEPRDVSNHRDEEVFILSTGSQGEELAALNVMAKGKHAWIHLKPTDTVIMSSNPIPGNQHDVQRLINQLYKSGIVVLQNSPGLNLHASGHANKSEQLLMATLLNPKYVMPIHGYYRKMIAQRDALVEFGIDTNNIFIAANGDKLKMVGGVVSVAEERIDIEDVYIENNSDATKSSEGLMKDRKVLSEEGVLAIIVTLDLAAGRIVSPPLVISRGSFYTRDSMEVVIKVSRKVRMLVEEALKNGSSKLSLPALKSEIRKACAPIIWREKKKNPLIIPIIIRKNLTTKNKPPVKAVEPEAQTVPASI